MRLILIFITMSLAMKCHGFIRDKRSSETTLLSRNGIDDPGPVTFPNDTDTEEYVPYKNGVCPQTPAVNETRDIIEAFEKFAIVPQIIPRAPIQLYRISKSSSTSNTLGTNKYTYPTTTYYQPRKYWDADPKKLYTVIYLNADINYILYGTFDYVVLALMVVNVPGNNMIKGDNLAPFAAFPPIPGYGSQRNVALVYEQANKIKVTLELRFRISTNILKFNLRQFVKEKRLGDPIAGNFFLSSVDLGFCDRSFACPKNLTCATN